MHQIIGIKQKLVIWKLLRLIFVTKVLRKLNKYIIYLKVYKKRVSVLTRLYFTNFFTFIFIC